MSGEINLREHGFIQWANDPSGHSWLAPDGQRVVTTEAAQAEIAQETAADEEASRG